MLEKGRVVLGLGRVVWGLVMWEGRVWRYVETTSGKLQLREHVQVTDWELSFGDEHGTKTPQKKHKLDPEFVLETSGRRGLAESSSKSNGQYVGHTSQLQAFIDQINATSTCATSDCNGQLKPVSIILTGLGGSVEVQYDCTVVQCTKYSSIVLLFMKVVSKLVGLALQVAFIAAGCTHAQYQKVLAHAFGMYAVFQQQFYNTLKRMYPHVKSMVDDQCELAKEATKAK